MTSHRQTDSDQTTRRTAAKSRARRRIKIMLAVPGLASIVVLGVLLLSVLQTDDQPDCDQVMADVIATLERGSLDLPEAPPTCQEEFKRDLDRLSRE